MKAAIFRAKQRIGRKDSDETLGGARGQETEIEISEKRILKLCEHINHIISERTGQQVEKVASDTDRDYFMSAEEAKDFGIIDEIIR